MILVQRVATLAKATTFVLALSGVTRLASIGMLVVPKLSIVILLIHRYPFGRGIRTVTWSLA